MFTFTQLKDHYTKNEEFISPRRVLVEYLQYELLDSLYKQKGSEQLSFMGGTSIRICYQGNRFSEDLDFDNFGLSFSAFQAMLNQVIDDMRRKGLTVEFRFLEKGAYHCYIKFPHLLHEHKISDHASEKILIKMESMAQKKVFTPRAHTINKFDLFYDLLVNPEDILLAQKLITILQRKRTKGRDFYDVSFLYGITQPSEDYVKAAMGLTVSKLIKQVYDYCGKLDFKALAKEVEPLLIRPDQGARVLKFPQFIAQKL
ncbi:nucleotidyl transferase AbiEii/AbiGii toxin family protein [Candidatus Uhrbacteria bacterium]|nr:nucleotidyl transferase AbiEii/AbiGii toxin family protein [Candidatus Uhrbacteria bacterium]